MTAREQELLRHAAAEEQRPSRRGDHAASPTIVSHRSERPLTGAPEPDRRELRQVLRSSASRTTSGCCRQLDSGPQSRGSYAQSAAAGDGDGGAARAARDLHPRARGRTTSRAKRSRPACPRSSAAAGRRRRRSIGWRWPAGWSMPAKPADGPGDGQSLLADVLRHRPGQDCRKTSACKASGPSIPSCSIGWPREFVEHAAGT